MKPLKARSDDSETSIISVVDLFRPVSLGVADMHMFSPDLFDIEGCIGVFLAIFHSMVF